MINNFLFSNAWLFIVVFFLLRMFFSKQTNRKGTGWTGRTFRDSRPNPKSIPMRSSKEVLVVDQDLSPHPLYEKGSSKQVDIEIVKTKENPVRNEKKGPDKADKVNQKNPPTPWASAVEGMMWSEVFGPPRSKKPYQRK